MSADNRTVHTDALATLGTILGPNEKRDAIHIAVEPVIAACNLRAGDHVGLGADGRATWDVPDEDLVGIVDPYLQVVVKAGDRFWLLLYPNQITSLRHVWEHRLFPASDAPPPRYVRRVPEAPVTVKAPGLKGGRVRKGGTNPDASQITERPAPPAPVRASEESVVTKALSEPTYEEAIVFIDNLADELDITRERLIEAAQDYLSHNEYLIGDGRYESMSIPDEFWVHYEVFTGNRVDYEDRGSFLSCNCI